MSEFQQVNITFTATMMTNFGFELDKDEIWDALNDALEGINENKFLIGSTNLEMTGDYDE
jgi:hypothetical protein